MELTTGAERWDVGEEWTAILTTYWFRIERARAHTGIVSACCGFAAVTAP
jgi:hypothetical protein